MQSDLFQKQLKRVMSQSTRNQVPITTQRKLYFIIPPLNEQNLIATSINQVKTPLESSKGHIESSMQLQKSLINEIFSS
jgi:type I restriction enzyme S subunit